MEFSLPGTTNLINNEIAIDNYFSFFLFQYYADNGVEEPRITKWKFINAPCPSQPNDRDCGLHVAVMMRLIAANLKFAFVNNRDDETFATFARLKLAIDICKRCGKI